MQGSEHGFYLVDKDELGISDAMNRADLIERSNAFIDRLYAAHPDLFQHFQKLKSEGTWVG